MKSRTFFLFSTRGQEALYNLVNLPLQTGQKFKLKKKKKKKEIEKWKAWKKKVWH